MPLPQGKTFSACLFADGGNVYGELTVEGFATIRSAREIGAKFAKVMEEHWPGATVNVSVRGSHTYLEENGGK